MAIANASNRFTRISTLVLFISLTVSCTSGIISPPRPKNVNIALQAKWSSTPLFLEAGELLSKYRDDYFWKFLDLWKPLPTEDATDEACFNSILGVANSILDGPLQSVFQLSLLLRSASPKLVLYRQLAEESLLQHMSSVEPDCHGSPDGDLQQCEALEVVDSFKSSCCWADSGNHAFLTEIELKQWLDSLQQSNDEEASHNSLEIFEFDHIFPQSGSSGSAIVLYSAPGTACFERFHSILADAAKSGLIKYVLRPFLAPDCKLESSKCVHMGSSNSLNLGGYGVELALKNMEYKAMDDTDVKKSDVTDEARADDLSQEVRGFIFSKLLERKPGFSDDLLTFRDHLLSSSVSETMNVWELKDLGYQTSQRIIHASEPLHVMQEINQNFPNLVSSISRLKLNDTIKDEIVGNQRMINPGKSLMAINGALINIEDLDLYSLVELVLGELTLADVISKMNVPSKYTKSLMQIPDPTELTSFRVDFRSPHVQYLNNLEEDAVYKRWRSNLQELLMPVFPGQMRYIRKNLFNSIYIIDPASPAGLKVIDNILYCYENNVPMRFGIILYSPTALEKVLSSGGELSSVNIRKDLSSLVGKLFLYVKDNYGAVSAYQFLSKVNEIRSGDFENQNDDQVELAHIEEAFFDIVKPRAKTPPQEILLKLEEGSEYDQSVLESTMFVYKLGLHHIQPCLIMNGMVRGSTSLQETITAMNEELPKIQEGVYFGHITSNTDVLDKFLKENGYSRYNPQIVSTSKENLKYVSLAKVMAGEYPVWSKLRFLHTPGTDDDVKPVTHLLSVDILSHQGLELLKQASRYLVKESKRGRVGVLFNIHDISIFSQASPTLLVARIITAALEAPGTSSKIVPFLDKFLSWYVVQISGTQNSIPDFDAIMEKASQFAVATKLKLSLPDGFVSGSASIEDFQRRISEETHFLSTLLGLQPGSNAVICNGKLFIHKQNHGFVAEDFVLLESVEYDRRVKPIHEIIENVDWANIPPDDLTSDFLSSVVLGISSAIALRSRGSDIARFDMLQAEYSAIIRQSENANIHVDAIVDPLSSVGQKLTPFFLILHEWFGASMRILLNPMSSLADLPLKNFYRFVVPSRHPFNGDGSFKPGPFALFSNMPPTRTLTMNLDVPEPWLVEPIKAIYDLDNILLEKLGASRTMYAVFELEALMLTGHCYEQNNGPPRGLQLLLGTKLKPHMVDTIVMANLGYWQLKAGPGVWNLSLAPGRSSELYTFHGIGEGGDNGPLTKQVVIKDLRGEVLHLEVVKRKGKEDETLLSADEEADDDNDQHNKKKGWNKDLLKWATDFLGGNKKQSEMSAQNEGKGRIIKRHGETINIFSIASGHLYERFLKIMMLSVLKNTQRPVKFWFIKNYLSPQFKDFIPHIAKEYGFEYELITYKWPTWLHKQTEKQRIIWAYKILFLDVIFPLSLRKVIFVDADQIVRADMGELYDMNLKGRPLAYTPFCDNNKEMDGYRFWNQGFWKDHLRGKPYHISALYVVDLVKFRQTAAGDNLRVFYETLSKDPGSLSNLDQDLPNYAQHQVPIFSLPQEWLWCESWCGNSTKAKAKTIDLCNNPMTKEPKLQGARRIVAEWPALDEEARELSARVLGDQGEAGLSSKLESPLVQSGANDAESSSETAAEL